MTIWLTSDRHFGHENTCRGFSSWGTRPFASAQLMDRILISNYRQVVKNEDTVYDLGDLTLAGVQHRSYVERILSQLPGRKIFIIGNHDKHNPFTYIELGYESVHTSLEVEEFILIHDPAASIMALDKTWLCGHIHTLFLQQRNCYNVGVDVHNFYPVSIDKIRKDIEETKVLSKTL